jgi:hypothetical protein
MVQIFCVRRPNHWTLQKIIRKKIHYIFIRNWAQASNEMYIPTPQWKHMRRCQSTKAPMQFFAIKETSEYEEDPNVQQPL